MAGHREGATPKKEKWAILRPLEKIMASQNPSRHHHKRANKAKVIGILHMAFDLTSMSRVFEKGTKDKFIKKFSILLPKLASITSAEEFDHLHDDFCRWGCRAIKTSRRGKRRASYGQVAKTLNVSLKATVYYCCLPDRDTAARLIPWLHPAIDNPMMGYLRDESEHDLPAKVNSIAKVDKRIYKLLLDLANQDNKKRFAAALSPIQWEDIVWLTINGKMSVRGWGRRI